jgi:hypothetical protein
MPEQILFIESNLGYWGAVEEHDSIELTVKSQIGNYETDNKEILSISNNAYVPQKGDKIYFMPGVTIPRVKFKNLSLTHGIKTVRNPEDATVFFANTGSIHKMTDSIWGFRVNTDEFRILMEDTDFTDKIDDHHVERVKTAIEFYTSSFLLVDRALANHMTSSKDFESVKENTRVLVVSDDYKDLIDASKNNIIYDESSIIDQLNGDNASVIDEDMYQQLTNMFDSSDKDNHVLAMEIMANCKYNASLVYILLLFKTQSTTMYNCHTKNHVNFKSLVNWISDNILSRHGIDDICKIIHEKGQFTPDKLDIILNHCKDDIIRYGDHNYFKVKTISVDPQYLAEMNNNYEYNIQDEFTPIVPEVQEVEEVIPVGEVEAPESEFAVEDNFEVISEEELAHDLYGVDNDNIEVSLTPEPESNNNHINTQDESNIDWF